jgi:hypothetical protein
MLGFRGAGRYVADSFRDCFALECEAVKRVRNEILIGFEVRKSHNYPFRCKSGPKCGNPFSQASDVKLNRTLPVCRMKALAWRVWNLSSIA